MELITTQHYGGNIFSFYSTKRKDIFMTINELALGFGYKSKNGIEKLIQRNPYLLGDKYSKITSLPVRNYGTDEMSVPQKEKNNIKKYEYLLNKGYSKLGVYLVPKSQKLSENGFITILKS